MKLSRIFQKNSVMIPVIAATAITIGLIGALVINKQRLPNGASCTGICVSIQADGINPNELAVKSGEFVQFNSADGKSHNLTTAPPSEKTEQHGHSSTASLSSGEFAADEAWRVQFKQPGTYQLRDTINPDQQILVVVYNES